MSKKFHFMIKFDYHNSIFPQNKLKLKFYFAEDLFSVPQKFTLNSYQHGCLVISKKEAAAVR